MSRGRRVEGRRSKSFWLAGALLLLAGCGCQKPPAPVDGGEPAPEVDAGKPAEEDAGFDGGEADAGPPPELKILKLLPPRGGVAGGSQVLLSGSAFIRDFATRGTEARKSTSLKFGSNPALELRIIDDETLEARVPPGKSGLTNVSITNPNGTFVCTGCFTYYEELYLGGLAPREGPLRGGNEVTLDGHGFTPEVEVLFGGFSSPRVSFVSSKQLKVLVPRGEKADLVDVAVYNKNGVGSQRRAYRYYPDLRIQFLAPLTGPLAGGTQVVISGQGLEGAREVKFGSAQASSFTVDSPEQLTAIAPPAASSGAVDLWVATPRDSFLARGAFTYVDPAGSFALLGIFPHLGAASGGETVTLTGQGLDAPGLTVSIGGQAVSVLGSSFSTATVTTPPRGAAARKVEVAAQDGALSGTLPGGFTYRLSLADLSPKVGPSNGGTAATIQGLGFPPDAEVFLGAQKATVNGAPQETKLEVTTPPGSGGGKSDLWVREAADPENEAVLEDAFTFEEPLSLGRVQPERGAIAGGTLLTVLGAGFGEGTVVTFGASKAKDVKVVDSHSLSCRTPQGSVGTVDVEVERLGQKDLLPGGFSYFDPRSISGGLSGGPLVGTLNVTVLESTSGLFGMPVPLANVMLGMDPATPFQGLTDSRGQLTFSDPSLVKAQAVTVWKQGYESTTVTAVSSENLTVFVSRTGGDGEPSLPPPGPPPSMISGRVTGFKAPRPLGARESLEARVFVSQGSLYGGPPFRGPPNKTQEKWVVTADGGEYLVFTGAGLRATYAILGVKNEFGQFAPYLMGIKRGITTSPDNPAVNQDIILDMHLDLTIPVAIDSPINVPSTLGPVPATNSVYAWLDLGAEGFIPNPHNWNSGTSGASSITSTAAALSFPGFPRLDGSNFIFLNEAAGAEPYPVSDYFRRQPGDLSLGVTIGPMLPAPRFTQPSAAGLSGTVSWVSEPGPAPNIHQVLILKRTLMGNVTLWSMVLPGSESQVVLSPPALQQLRDEEKGNQLFAVLFSSRSPKFSYTQWSYESLSWVSWSSYTIAVSEPFLP